MTIDTIKHLGTEFHRAADSLADTLARLDNARLERLTFLRRCSKDSTARLAAIKEEVRTLPEQIAKWDAEAARLESQTAEDLLRRALETKGGDANATRDNGGARDGVSTSSYARSGISPDGLQVDAPSVGKAEGEPYRAGLPPERLRKVWAEWEDAEGDVVTFKGDRFSWSTWRQDNHGALIEYFTASDQPALRPHGATWARVEAMADEAERAAAPKMLDLRTVRDDSNHTDPDVVMADDDLFDAGESAATKAPLIRKGETFTVEREVSDHGKGPRVKVTREGQGQRYIAALQPAHVVPTPPAPTLLDLTKLPPGTVCEVVATVFSENLSRQMPAGTRFVIKEHASDGDVLVESLDARQMWVRRLQPARVVKEGGEQ